eukprot:6486891-Amphidinium_carterae.2
MIEADGWRLCAGVRHEQCNIRFLASGAVDRQKTERFADGHALWEAQCGALVPPELREDVCKASQPGCPVAVGQHVGALSRTRGTHECT